MPALKIHAVHPQIRPPAGDLRREPATAAARVQHGGPGRRGGRHVVGDPPVHTAEHLVGMPVVGLSVAEKMAPRELVKGLEHDHSYNS
jgi:hypothetical protein